MNESNPTVNAIILAAIVLSSEMIRALPPGFPLQCAIQINMSPAQVIDGDSRH